MSGSNILDTEKIRRDFPILDVEVREGVPLVYLDSAATSHTPNIVCESIEEYYKKINSNIHRGTHKLSMDATDAYEEAHDKLVEFVGGSAREEMIFTKNENIQIFKTQLTKYAFFWHGPIYHVILPPTRPISAV